MRWVGVFRGENRQAVTIGRLPPKGVATRLQSLRRTKLFCKRPVDRKRWLSGTLSALARTARGACHHLKMGVRVAMDAQTAFLSNRPIGTVNRPGFTGE